MSSDGVAAAAAPSHEQKAQLLLEMANAVEESNARKRHYQYQHQQHHHVDAFAMDQLINDLESASAAVCGAKPAIYATEAIEPTKNSSAPMAIGDSAATSTMTASLESETSVLSAEQKTPNQNSTGTNDSMRKYVERQRRKPIPRQHPPHSQQQKQQQQSRQRPRPRRTSAAPVPVDPYQVQLLYAAMVSYRENSDLRYQLLELRHLDLRQSFVEMETRYRLMESQQEAWKQSCQVLQQQQLQPKQLVSTEEAGENDENSGSVTASNPDSECPPNPAMISTTISTSNNALQTHTVPHLQQEMRSLSSQRNQLLQANLELRKQLKQIQILQTQQQQEFGQQGLNSCQRCHPELFAVKQEREVDRAMEHVVENFQSASNTRKVLSARDQRHKNHRPFRQEGKGRASMADEAYHPSVNDSFSQSMGVDDESEDEHQHEDNMSLTGMHLGGSSNHNKGHRDSNSNTGSAGVPPTKQQSIVWSPPTSSNYPQLEIQRHGNIVSPSSGQKAKSTAMMTPTINSFLPMQQPGDAKDSHDIDVSPRRESNNKREHTMHDISSKDIPVVTPLKGNRETERSRGQSSQEQGMGRFGMLDEFGRSLSNRRLRKHDIGENSTPSTREVSKTAGTTGMKSLFRRKASEQQQQHEHNHNEKAPPSRKVPPEMTRQSQTMQRYSVGDPASSDGINAKHVDYKISGNIAVDRQSLPGSQPSPMMMNSRHLEFSVTPEKVSPSPRQTRPKLQVNHPGGSMLTMGAAPGNRQPSPGKIRRPASHDTKAPTPHSIARSNVTGRNVSKSHPVAPNGHRGGQLYSAKQMARSSQKHPERMNGAHIHHQSQGRQHQQHQHTPKGKDNQEKPETSSRAQSYFQRIKKTLQQEI